MNPRLKTLAALLPLLPCCPAQAVEQLAALDTVVVTATRQSQRARETLSDITVIDAEEIRNAGPATTITELLARQPGIEMKQSGGAGQNADVFIRGSNSSHVLLLVDGMRTGSLTTGTPNWAFIPLEQIDHIEIVRGPASSLYGSEAIGGVVQIFTKRGEGPFSAFAEAGLGTYNTAALSTGFSGAQNGWRYSFQLSDKQSSSFSAIKNPADPSYNPDKDGFQTISSSGSLSYAPARGHEIGINYLYSDGWNRFDAGSIFTTPASDDYKQKETIYGVNIHSRNQLTDLWTSTLRIGQTSDDSHNLDNGQQSSFFHSTQTQYQWQNDIKLPVGIALLGAERVEQQVSSSADFAQKERNINSFLAGWTGRLGDHSLQLNGRQDRNSQFGNKATGMAAYGYQLSRDWRGNLSWGTAFKAPSFNDLYFPPDGYGDVSNPNLKPETSKNREASLHYETSTQHASVTYYRNEVLNLIQWAPIDPSDPYSGWTPQNVARATLSGWTLAYSGRLGDYKVSGSFDHQDPKDDVLQKTLIYRARDIAKLAVSRDFGALNVGSEILTSGKRYSDTANTKELGGYTLVNLSASYHVAKDWSIFARANNVFDTHYVLVKNYATPGANLFVGVRYTLN
ncbi:MAG: TonB-dependent receptor domain-containing protein [Bacteroidota bacterium]